MSIIFFKAVVRLHDYAKKSVVCRGRSCKSLCTDLLSWGGDLETLVVSGSIGLAVLSGSALRQRIVVSPLLHSS